MSKRVVKPIGGYRDHNKRIQIGSVYYPWRAVNF